MNKLKAIIIDDEDHCRSSLTKQLEWSCPNVEVVGQADSAVRGKDLILGIKPDIIFLDIEMPGGTGFDLIRSIPGFMYKVIFTTAYDEYALEAFKVNAVAYLLKPIDGDELEKAVAKISTEKSEDIGGKLEKLMNYLRSNEQSVRKIALPIADGVEFVHIDDIIRCESEGNYCYVYLNDGSKMFLSKTLKQISELINSQKFIRVHNSHYVNMDYVKRYLRGKGGQIIMDDGSMIPVSRTKKDEFLDNF